MYYQKFQLSLVLFVLKIGIGKIEPYYCRVQKHRRLQKLEAVRGLAAFYVFLHHFVHLNEDLIFLRKYFIFGQLAVLTFFVLSGFVIYYASIGRKPALRFRDFFVHRFRRIYPPFLLALALGWVVRSIAIGEVADPNWDQLLGNLFMLQDKNIVGSWFSPYLGNSPLWSLSYEWWFYMMFFGLHLLTRKRPQQQKFIALGLSILGFISFQIAPNPISLFLGYFILWWSGLELAREYLEDNTLTWRRQAISIASVGLAGICWGIPAFIAYRSGLAINIGVHPFIEFRHFSSIFLVLFAGITWYKLKFIGFQQTLSIFSRLAPISYALYIVHLPIIAFAVHFQFTGSAWLDFLWVTPLVLGLSWVIEQPFQKWINTWLR